MDEIIKEIFDKYQIRKSKKQKTAFIDFTLQRAAEEGYSVNIEKGMLGTRNIVVGDPDNAEVVYTAHYDTCARLPFPNFLTPKSIGIYLLYNLLVLIGFFAVAFVLGVAVGVLGAFVGLPAEVGSLVAQLVYLAMVLLILEGPANKHTANDNTSGVTVLFGIMKALAEEDRSKVAFVFFDNEELGLIGSSVFAKKHKNVKNNVLLVNFDCVSDGKDMMILVKKAAQKYTESISRAFVSCGDIEVDITKNAFYPSDQAKFKAGVGVAAFKRTKGGLLYMNRIHTSKDTVYRRENIDFLIDGAAKLASII